MGMLFQRGAPTSVSASSSSAGRTARDARWLKASPAWVRPQTVYLRRNRQSRGGRCEGETSLACIAGTGRDAPRSPTRFGGSSSSSSTRAPRSLQGRRWLVRERARGPQSGAAGYEHARELGPREMIDQSRGGDAAARARHGSLQRDVIGLTVTTWNVQNLFRPAISGRGGDAQQSMVE